MERFATLVENGNISIETAEGSLAIGQLDDVVDLIGGETYAIEYGSDHSRAVDWLDLDDDDTLRIDVRETITDMDFPEPFVSELADKDGGESPSERTRYFAQTMQRVWDAKGNLDEDENPFL